jgi:A/G-specific adenine glycosylase
MHDANHVRYIRVFHQELLQWYERNGRDLPWRRTQDPYHILVSEIMLHQTQVNRVLPKYFEWLKVYPTFKALASAPLIEVKQLWKPLGYNFRPERLHKIAQYVVNERDGKLPDTIEDLIALPGIGRYTAGAILSFAFHKDAAIVDTNVRRIIQRVFGIEGNPLHGKEKNRIWQIAEALIPPGKAYIFNQALLDFGALLCTAQNPHCSSCFMHHICIWNNNRTHS